MFHNEDEKDLANKALHKVPVEVTDEGFIKEYIISMQEL